MSITTNQRLPARTTSHPGRYRLTQHPWVLFTMRRLGRLVFSMLLLVTGSFAMIHAVKGDPVRAALGLKAPAALVEATRHRDGLDRPLPDQYLHYMMNVITGHLGTSFVTQLPVSSTISERLPPTLELAALSFLVVLLVGVPLGMTAAILTRHGRRPKSDLGFSFVTGFFAVVPEFLLAVGLVFLFAVTWKIFPVAGQSGPLSLILPVAALAAAPLAVLARLARVETLRVLDMDYMRTAYAKRLPSRILYVRHALPNIMTATLTWSGLLLSGLIAGTVLIENIFALPGIGSALTQSVAIKDYPVVQATALILGTFVLLINLIVDVLVALVDPRSTIRES